MVMKLRVGNLTSILASIQTALLVLHTTKEGWKIRETLEHLNPSSAVFDPFKSERAYCGTFDNGLWKSDDQGQTWDKTSLNTSGLNIMSIAVSKNDKGESGFGRLFVGTEPSLIFTSNDGGQTWDKIDEFNKLPSSSTWSFPPRPQTHHVRWIEPDINDGKNIFAAIEAGALIKSADGGKSWIDRVKTGPYDTHVLRTHKMTPQRLYSAAGDGYFESQDYGNRWKRIDDGLGTHTYLSSIAINSDNPQNKIVSSSSNAWSAHSRQEPESFIYRYSTDGDEKWELMTKGLPKSNGTIISILESLPDTKDEFYCLNNQGMFCSKDSGFSWERLEISWPKEYYLQHPWALAVRE